MAGEGRRGVGRLCEWAGEWGGRGAMQFISAENLGVLWVFWRISSLWRRGHV